MPTWTGSSYSRRKTINNWVYVALIVVIAVVFLFAVINYAQVKPVDHVKITGKESINTGDGHEYRIYTDQGTFVAKDSLVHPRFNTSDFYGRLEIGKTYDCEAYGYRIPFFSVFRNLQSCKEVR